MSMTGEIYIQPISAVGKKAFPLSPIFHSSLTFLFFLLVSLPLINLPSGACNDCHETMYLNY